MTVLPQTPLDWVLIAVARREEKQLEVRFGEAYRTYQLGTGMVMPSLLQLLRAQR